MRPADVPAPPRPARRRLLGLALLAAGLGPAAAQPRAASIEQLRTFLRETRSARGEFTQRSSGRAASQSARGHFAFLRPGRFRWTVDAPYEQVIVSDGERLVLYDKDLQQVTIRTVGASLPASPAAILFGTQDIDRSFEIEDLGSRDGLLWVAARPRQRDGTIERIEIGLQGGLPLRMWLDDSFGQRSEFAFSAFERNPRLDDGQFRFVPPAGVDVLEER